MGRWLTLGIFCAGLTACSGNDDGGSSAIGLECAEGTFALDGTLDGQAVSHQGELAGIVWVQGGTPTFDTSFSTGGSLHIEWAQAIADGATTGVTGRLTLPPDGARAGETLDSASGSMTKLDEGIEFVLRDLSVSVACVTAPCAGDPVAGSVRGCAQWGPR